MPASYKFVHVQEGKSGTNEGATRKAVRSHVMKNYRRRQRQEYAQQRAPPVIELRSDFSDVLSLNVGHIQEVDGSLCGAHSRCETCCCCTGKALETATHHIHERDESNQKFLSSRPTAPSSVASTAYDDVESVPLSDDKRHMIMRYSSKGITAISQTLRSPALYRTLLLQAFVEGFFPSHDQTSPVLVGGLNRWVVAKCPAIELINDANGLMQLGTTCQDQGLITEGQRRQVLAVQSLRSDLCKPGFSYRNASCTVINIMVSGLYSATSAGAAGCVSHIAGLTALLHAHSRDPTAEALAPQLLKDYHRMTLMHALINRKAITASDAILERCLGGAPGSVESLMQLSSRLPRLLEASSPRYRKASHRNEVASLQVLASLLAKEFDVWLQDYEKPGFRYRRSPLEFLSFVDANILGLYWCSRLLLAECSAQLQSIADSGRGSQRSEVIHCYEDEADMYAAYLFDAAVAIQKYEGSALSKAMAVRTPLYFAGKWWLRSGDRRRLQKVLDMESRMRSDLPAIDWDTVLYWSFVAIMWLV